MIVHRDAMWRFDLEWRDGLRRHEIVAKTVTHSNRYRRQLARKGRLKLPGPTINALRI